MEELKKHPPWKEVARLISDETSENGYGKLWGHEDLKKLLDIKEPITIEEYKLKQFEYLNALDKLRTALLEDHNMWLENARGNGYVVATPDDQVTKSCDKFIDKAKHNLKKSGNILGCVIAEKLTEDAAKSRLTKLQKVAFLSAAFRKRKFVELEEKKTEPKVLMETSGPSA